MKGESKNFRLGVKRRDVEMRFMLRRESPSPPSYSLLLPPPPPHPECSLFYSAHSLLVRGGIKALKYESELGEDRRREERGGGRERRVVDDAARRRGKRKGKKKQEAFGR